MESQWKLRQQYDQNLPIECESLQKKNTSVRRKKEIQKSKTVKVIVTDTSRRAKHLRKVISEKL